MSEAHAQAVQLARFYFRTITERAGATWEGDNDVEVELMVSHIIDAAAGRLRAQLDDAIRRIRVLENCDDMDGALDRIEALERKAGMP
ncbi:MAG TPA: hypothetical protein VFQ68_16375 [Streptosporangiaceae bacterium]|nr:hypothetical protein [Streptosporangiaceae bacterium]